MSEEVKDVGATCIQEKLECGIFSLFTMTFSKMKTDCVGFCNEHSSVLQSADCLMAFAY